MKAALVVAAALGVAGAVASIVPAEAASRTVTACSRFGHGCITAPIRRGPQGYELRLPGGTWISCALDCPTTLRDETVDFWAKRDWERSGERVRRD